MLMIVFVLMFLLAIILMFHGFQTRAPYIMMLCSVIWFIMALFLLQGLEEPYTMYNATSGAIESGTNTIHSNALNELSYFFILMGLLSFIFFITYMLEYLYKPPKEL